MKDNTAKAKLGHESVRRQPVCLKLGLHNPVPVEYPILAGEGCVAM